MDWLRNRPLFAALAAAAVTALGVGGAALAQSSGQSTAPAAQQQKTDAPEKGDKPDASEKGEKGEKADGPEKGEKADDDGPGGHADEPEIDGRPQPQQGAAVLGAAEGTQLDHNAGGPAHAGGEVVKPRLVERLEGQDPGGDLGDRLEALHAQGVADLSEQPGGQPRAEHHEQGDAVGGGG